VFWRRPKAEVPAEPEPAEPQAAPPEETEAAEPASVAQVAHASHEPGAEAAPLEAVEPDGSPPSAGPESQPSIESGLRPSRGFVARLRSILGAGTDEAAWEEVEETLIAADIGARLAIDVVAAARRRSDAAPVAAVQAELRDLLTARPAGDWSPPRPIHDQPAVILVVGVNGTGKTTSIAKLAARQPVASASCLRPPIPFARLPSSNSRPGPDAWRCRS
jgi:fused signal recognition particle receptor